MPESLLVKEIYLSVQGESSWAGLPCVFVRLTGCDLRCSYCDSAYAFRGGQAMSVAQVQESVRRFGGFGGFGGDAINHGRLPLVELTGGEPLLQKAVLPLMAGLCEAGHQVLLETSGAHDIGEVHPSVCRIVDLKCPSSGETARIAWENIDKLRSTDEVKFVIATREDYEWARDQLTRHRLVQRCSVLFSCSAPLSEGQQCDELHDAPPAEKVLTREALVDAILADRLPVRFQLQMHKFIWPPDQQGV